MENVGGRGHVTLADVAREAEVSLSTVSKVLNGRSDVSRSTRERVEELLRAYGYQRGTRGGAAPLIEIVFHELDSLWAMELIRGVEAVARGNDAGVVVTCSGTRHAPGPEWIEDVLRRRPMGVVLVFSSLPAQLKRQLRSRAIPFVVIDPAGDPEADVPSVGSANWAGGLAATRHLIEQGHRRIGIITGPEDMLCSLARLDGYRSAMAMAGLEVDPSLIAFGDFHAEGGNAHAKRLLERDDRPSAIFAGSDLQALGVLDAARVCGLRVPDDLSVVGYDDLDIAKWTSPALTTVRQPLREMAEQAAQLILRLREDDTPAPTRLELATTLVVRASTAPPATA
ncbi:LacI family DNA-binding transcriptional regulator [Streptomyces sp. AF1A]|jgi:LacI family xylobiose transport system transcriptional regulator|uniref:LacI family DNA-binding transcriptional regulator n=1 Tax=Streptomyces sp. AF1A TaxID=3394350 RepID=UPI0039BD3CFC